MILGTRGIALTLPGLLLAAAVPATAGNDEPDVVVVQHILIGFKKTVRGKEIDRTKKEARTLAEELLERSKSLDDNEFDALVEEYTDDRYPGIYRLTNRGVPLQSKSYTRDDMVGNFGRVAFRLEVGEVGMATYHPGNSPFGWHIIRRIE